MFHNVRIHACAALLLTGSAACSGGNDGDDSTTAGSTGSSSTGAPTSSSGSSGGSDATAAGPTTGAVDTTGTTGAPEPTTADTGTDDTSTTPPNTSSETGDTGDTGTTGPVEPTGSAGCGLADPESGSLTIDVQGQMAQFIVSLPPNYDPMTPYPLGFAFHGRNRTGPNCQDGDCAGFQDVMEDEAILVYMTSLGGTGWEGDGERELNVEFFEKVLGRLTMNHCIDEGRVFAAGTSSGAHFVNILGCRFGDRLLAIAPVAGYLPETEDCVDKVAALVIHGFKDPHVPLKDGEKAREFWRGRNGCTDQTTPTIAEVHASVEGAPETHLCAEYQGCEAGLPVVWCEHSEGGYDDSTHGWPLFGGQRIWEFVKSL